MAASIRFRSTAWSIVHSSTNPNIKYQVFGFLPNAKSIYIYFSLPSPAKKIGSISNEVTLLNEVTTQLGLSIYGWMEVRRWREKCCHTSADYEIETEAQYLVNISSSKTIPIRRTYWDLEVYGSEGFPSSNQLADEIFMISVAYDGPDGFSNSLLHTKDIGVVSSTVDCSQTDLSTCPVDKEDFALIRCSNESDLIASFVFSYKEFMVDRTYTYNGYSFDSPYLADRVHLLNIDLPSVTKIDKLTTGFRTRRVRSPYGFGPMEFQQYLYLPGVEHIDLLPFFRKFYPALLNHKLDTVSHHFLSTGKTGLSIDELNEGFRTSNSSILLKGAQYGMVDSILLRKLVDILSIDHRLESLANHASINIETLLQMDDRVIAQYILKKIYPESEISIPREKYPIHKREKGFYRAVSTYDYSNLYIDEVIQIADQGEDESLYDLVEVMMSCHPHLKYLLYNYVVNRTGIGSLVIDLPFSSKDNINRVIYRDEVTVIVQDDEKIMVSELITRADYLLVFSPSSYISILNGKLERKGTSAVIKTDIPFVTQLIDQYILAKLGYGVPLPEKIVIDTDKPIERFIGQVKVRDSSTYGARESLAKTISSYYDLIEDNRIVDYIRVLIDNQSIPIPVEFFNDSYQIDYNFYANQVNKALRLIDSVMD